MDTLQVVPKDKKDDTIYAELPIRESVEMTQLAMYKRLLKILKLKEVINNGD